MSLMQFSMRLRLYDDDFIHTNDYTQLETDYPPGVTPQHVYRILRGDSQYEPRVSKATCLVHLSHRYIHAILIKSVNGHGDSTGILSLLELLYLYSMV